MALLDWWAIGVALFALFGVSIVGGLIFGFGLSIDAFKTIDDPERLDSDEIDEQMDNRFDEAFATRTTQAQLVALTFAGALIGGAVVALKAPQSPLANAAVVAAISAAANFIPVGDYVPRRVQIVGAVASIAGVLLAAYALR
ncbi:hypothetical protein [uncultured Maritimibacter sp.]|jgi:hypothetical protein|uniref:hypothetical protein n=1 Tax=uncultured Maritimibacter sp. TaxID=991866 RepID=UPI00263A181A|nr:hypothetical protein [uncultured Maritimibacter sp.]